MNFKDTTTDTLPAIPKTKHGLVDAGRRGTRSPHCFEDSGLDLRESLVTSRLGSSSTRTGSAKSPPGLLVKAATVPLSPRPQSPLRRVSLCITPLHMKDSYKWGSKRALPTVQLNIEYRSSDAYPTSDLCCFLQSLESLRLSRGELDRREQAVNSLRY